MTDRDVGAAAESIRYELETVTPSNVIEAAPEERREEAKDVVQRLEAVGVDVMDLMADIERVVHDA
jgi:hypothetical protein